MPNLKHEVQPTKHSRIEWQKHVPLLSILLMPPLLFFLLQLDFGWTAPSNQQAPPEKWRRVPYGSTFDYDIIYIYIYCIYIYIYLL